MLEDLAKHSEAEFLAAFQDESVDSFLGMMQGCGIEAKRLPRKTDTIKAAYALIAEAAKNPPSTPVGDPAPSEAATLSDGGQVFLIRSRQPAGRWRAGRFFLNELVEVKASEFTPHEWGAIQSDPALDVREV